ncbi:M56 family metallopeptidase [Blautia acetigignens]|uniref:M56 family metallopeptidase n=1 Tax=Blautia acetigignens TaxID=2981783 RepID=A0ABV1CJQ9_9FIRM
MDLREHRRNDAAFGLSPADALKTEKLFLPAWPETGVTESGGIFYTFSDGKYLLPLDVLEETNSLNAISYFVNFDDKEAVSYHGISVWMPDWILMIVLCWLFVIAGFSIYETIKYHQLTRKLKRITEIRTYPLPGIGNVEYRISPEMNTPYTVGFVKPFIVVPAEFPNSRLSEMILRHEYSHLRCRDSIVKLICLLAICLHCFNPLTILTFLLYTRFSENIADEAATEGCSDEERRAYAKALVRLSARTRQVPVVWRNNLLGDKKESMKRRVELIMNRNKKASKIGTVAAVLASVILSGTTVFAYTPMQTTRVHNDSVVADPQSAAFISMDSQDSLFANSNVSFETEDHIVIPVDDSDLEPRAILCIHNFKSGYADLHYPQSNGGCIMRRYTAKICQKCNHLEIYDLVNTITYAKCIH